ncbi:tRNA (5-methylaminomethyl-2-thiouridylate)-methyltransferase / FAD-dependent cmnm(5)s(2)U34 oxidoreductase [hydrothermal vent metagenome]|uniref:tRNA (5-methylaminomethyl-2-thiouridylate)-methyltransferase / FAD-dependent cmnm(5)s(2)U34 oxidoreductase n=1 Tax=hydrothermal vent metagenome TaxID=652676 RepID=A0A1W1ELK6_9ZZZZ
MKNYYDTIIIGAGVAGANIAYSLFQKAESILVISDGIIASNSAGAFVSSKIGKASPLKTLTDKSFEFAKDFYISKFPKYYHQTGVIRLPKDKKDSEKFDIYREFNTSSFRDINIDELKKKSINSLYDGFIFDDAGVCDSEICQELLKDIEVVDIKVQDIKRDNDLWQIDRYSSKNLILATGYRDDLFDIKYMGIGATYGCRGDFKSNIDIPNSLHKNVSISKNFDGIIKIGATHRDEKITSMIEKASHLIDISKVELIKTYCGNRAGSRDYSPLVGKIIDVKYMLDNYPNIKKGRTYRLKYIDNLFILNGLGGRGFVLAPLMAKMLSEYIIDDIELPKEINPDRLFFKWCRKL